MKKFVLSLSVALLTVLTCVVFSACAGVPAESIAFNETSVTLEIDVSHELTYTVQPENARVKFEISDNSVVKYANGTLTALTAGTATVKAYSPADESVYSECKVTVRAPYGYALYSNDDCKFVYPSSWSKTSVTGTLVSYNSNSSTSVNLTSESKNNAYFTANASSFQNTIVEAYKNAGITATFSDCKVGKDKYYGYTRVHVVYDYSVRGLDLHQEQMILNSGDKTYVLTVTNASDSQTKTIFSQFIGKK